MKTLIKNSGDILLYQSKFKNKKYDQGQRERFCSKKKDHYIKRT